MAYVDVIFRLHVVARVFLPQGITLKLNAQGRCTVSRIIHGGMIHRQGIRLLLS